MLSPIKNVRTTVRSIVAGYNDGTLRIFNLLHGQMVLKLHPHTSSTTAIDVPSNSTYIRKVFIPLELNFMCSSSNN